MRKKGWGRKEGGGLKSNHTRERTNVKRQQCHGNEKEKERISYRSKSVERLVLVPFALLLFMCSARLIVAHHLSSPSPAFLT